MKFEKTELRLRNWISWMARHPWLVLVSFIPLAAIATYLFVTQLGLNSDLTDLISDRLSFHKNWKEYRREFPYLTDNILVVVSGETAGQADDAAEWLAAKLRGDNHFEKIFRLNTSRLLEAESLYYLSETDLQKFSGLLQQTKPLWDDFAKEQSLGSYFHGLSAIGGSRMPPEIFSQLDEILKGDRLQLDYAEIFGEPELIDPKRFIELTPRLDYSELLPAQKSIQVLHEIINQSGLSGVSFGVTGVSALSYEEMKSVSDGAALSGIISFILVALILFWACRSFGLIAVMLVNLVLGLILTAGFAALVVGHLNMISVAFAVLFIGLGVDYSIHLGLHYLENLKRGRQRLEALIDSFSEVGVSLLICTLTTCFGFFAFVPTAYKGVSELGLIAGVGMIINLLVHLTWYPAVLSLMPKRELSPTILKFSVGDIISRFSYRQFVWIRAFGMVLLVVTAILSMKIAFDSNPLNLQDPKTEAYQTYRTLLKDADRSPWTIKLVVDSKAEADELVTKLDSLDSVSQVIGLTSFLPTKLGKKKDILRKAKLNPLEKARPVTKAENLEAIAEFVQGLGISTPEERRLRSSLSDLILNAQEDDLDLLRGAIVTPSLNFYRSVQLAADKSRQPGFMLPDEVMERYLSAEGKYRLEVFPKKDLMDMGAMREFADEVLKVAPRATDDPVTLPLTGDAVVEAFIEALILAGILIFLTVFVLSRSLIDSILVMCPLVLGSTLIISFMVVARMDFNFANIIVLPLLLGIGVDSGVHIVHRFRKLASFEDGDSSTSRAIFFSSLTTIASFGTLALSSHRGTASMGVLLAVGTFVMMLSSLGLLPALLHRKTEEKVRRAA